MRGVSKALKVYVKCSLLLADFCSWQVVSCVPCLRLGVAAFILMSYVGRRVMDYNVKICWLVHMTYEQYNTIQYNGEFALKN